MPLVRYEVRCEHSLANPELYRTAGQDDSEGLLEGVAMAGLVGLVRQLGDLAEFAAEIFHDLHDDILAMVSRSKNLKSRVTRLEVDLPAVEKALIAECTQFQFAYSARTKWRAPLSMDQNLCAQGDLPRFVRNFYDDCRGPPRLFLLDKFDEAGRGACVKRYTDPTFFRISWAASLISKAEQQRREREAEFRKKTTAADANAGPKIFPRERLSSALFENLEGFTGDFIPELRSRRLDYAFELPAGEGELTPDGSRSPEDPRSPVVPPRRLPQVAQGPVLAPLKMSSKDSEPPAKRKAAAAVDEEVFSAGDSSTDDAGEEYYVDALTTMGSDELDSEPGSRTRWEIDSNVGRLFGVESEEEDESLNHSVLKAHVEAHRKTPPRIDEDEDEKFAKRFGLAGVGSGFDTVRGWEDSGGQTEEASGGSPEESIELASVASVGEDGAGKCLAIVARSVFQEEAVVSEKLTDTSPDELRDRSPDELRDTSPDELRDTSPDELRDTSPDELRDMSPDESPDTIPEVRPDTIPGDHSDTLSDKFPYSLPQEPPHNLSVELPDRLRIPLPDMALNPLFDSLPSSPPDRLPPPLDEAPDTFSDKLPYQSPEDHLPSVSPRTPPSALPDTVSGKAPEQLPDGKPLRLSPLKLPHQKSSDKLSGKSPTKPPGSKLPSLPLPLPPAKRPHRRPDRLPDKHSDKPPTKAAPKRPEKPSYQSHASVSLLDSCRPSVRVKPIVASIEARTQAAEKSPQPQPTTLTEEEPLPTSTSGKLSPVTPARSPVTTPRSPVTTPRSRRQWTQENATRIHASILQLADMDEREGTNGARREGDSPEVDPWTSHPPSQEPGAERAPPGSHVSSPGSVEEGYTSSASSSPKGLPTFCALLSPSESPPRVAEGVRGRRSPPVTPFLADSPSVSRSPSLDVQLALPVRSFLGSPGGRVADKPSTLPNPVPRPRTWVDRSESNVAATLRAIRQAAAVASDDDAGSECRSDC